ncbi:hypothetical protein V8E55_001351 [Tylopilus felleus]
MLNCLVVDQVQFFEQEHLADAFGFIDPESVIHGVHLVPAFTYDQTDQYLGPSFVHLNRDDLGWNEDWRFYYVNMFVDRDMFMWFRGSGVGHKSTRDWDQILQQEGCEVRQDPDLDLRDGEEELEMVIGSDLEEEDNLELQVDEENRGEPEDRSDEEHELDQIMADEGEELDKNIWAQEGYEAL